VDAEKWQQAWESYGILYAIGRCPSPRYATYLDDVTQAARLGVWEAGQTYNPALGAASSWVRVKVRSELGRMLRSGWTDIVRIGSSARDAGEKPPIVYTGLTDESSALAAECSSLDSCRTEILLSQLLDRAQIQPMHSRALRTMVEQGMGIKAAAGSLRVGVGCLATSRRKLADLAADLYGQRRRASSRRQEKPVEIVEITR
jgi:hypothetical protein